MGFLLIGCFLQFFNQLILRIRKNVNTPTLSDPFIGELRCHNCQHKLVFLSRSIDTTESVTFALFIKFFGIYNHDEDDGSVFILNKPDIWSILCNKLFTRTNCKKPCTLFAKKRYEKYFCCTSLSMIHSIHTIIFLYISMQQNGLTNGYTSCTTVAIYKMLCSED